MTSQFEFFFQKHIIYNEWIPATIGINPNTPELKPLPLNNYYKGYDPSVIICFLKSISCPRLGNDIFFNVTTGKSFIIK